MIRRVMINHHEFLENMVASVIDVTSVMIAYTIGVSQSSLLVGLAYGLLDALLVVWMRKPLTRAVRFALSPGARKLSKSDVYVADV